MNFLFCFLVAFLFSYLSPSYNFFEGFFNACLGWFVVDVLSSVYEIHKGK
jgi:hypothetical protein